MLLGFYFLYCDLSHSYDSFIENGVPVAQHFDDHSKLGSPRGAVHIIFRRTQGKLELVRLIN